MNEFLDIKLPVSEEQVLRFMKLFRGLDRARGIWWPKNGSMETSREEPKAVHFAEHLVGEVGLGITPINSENKCHWGVIDVDAHEPDWEVNIARIAMKVEEYGLPLVTCLSKSRGAHLYLFLEDPQPASKIKKLLQEWANLIRPAAKIYSIATGNEIGTALIEIFPKQERLAEGQLGNWVNLPYFNAPGTPRFAWHSNKELSLDEFLDLAEAKSKLKDHLNVIKPGHPDAPPCVQQMLINGVDMGQRNNSLFAIGTYLRKAGVDSLEEELLKINYDKHVMGKPLPKGEVATIAKSVSKGTYNYRCNEPPICDLCDKELCQSRKFGVGKTGPSKNYDALLFGSLKKILTDPPRWVLEINGVSVEMSTEQLLDYKAVRKVAIERVGVVGPPMKAEDWAIVLRTKNEQREEISAPDDAGPGAMIRAMLQEFTRPVERTEEGRPRLGKKEDLLRGLPVVMRDEDTEEVMVYFRGADFISMLRKKRAEEFKGAALWSVLRQIGCSHDKVRIGSSVIQVWTKPFSPWDVVFESPKPKEVF